MKTLYLFSMDGEGFQEENVMSEVVKSSDSNVIINDFVIEEGDTYFGLNFQILL